MFYGGELNVPGAPGNNWVGNSTPVVNIGYGGEQGLISHGKHTPDEVIHGIPRYWHPGSHDPVQHNPLVDPAGNFIPGTAKPDSEIPLSRSPATGNPLAGLADIPGSSVGNMAGFAENMEGKDGKPVDPKVQERMQKLLEAQFE